MAGATLHLHDISLGYATGAPHLSGGRDRDGPTPGRPPHSSITEHIMKLIVQIPCFNEEDTLAGVVADIPRSIAGIDSVELLVIDDGSSDGTVDLARRLGVDHIVKHSSNQGLARAFRTGLGAGLELGADIIVNTDGDNQYFGADIPLLIEPILDGYADIVVGDRETHKTTHFSALKRKLQSIGSRVVRVLSGTQVPDAVSGFRAISREAALRLNIVSPFSYTIEMLIQAGNRQLKVVSVPVRTNPPARDSRLARSTLAFVAKSMATMVRMYAMYRPLSAFSFIGAIFLGVGLLPIIRFLYFYATGSGAGHVQSLVLGGVLVIVGFMVLMIGLVADLINFNRQLIEMTLEKVRRIELRETPPQGGARVGRDTVGNETGRAPTAGFE
jgi:glycosyltransferase involved in cell wall biosynthesis